MKKKIFFCVDINEEIWIRYNSYFWVEKKKTNHFLYNACIRPSNLKKLSNKQTFIFSLQIVSVFFLGLEVLSF